MNSVVGCIVYVRYCFHFFNQSTHSLKVQCVNFDLISDFYIGKSRTHS